jgi:hypothetical protein
MSDITLTQEADCLTFTFPQWNLNCILSRFKASREGTSAELTIDMPHEGKLRTLTSGIINLSALVTRDRLAKRLGQLVKDTVEWDAVVETICVRGLQEYRKGEPIESLEPHEGDCPARFLLNPFVYEEYPTLLYGPGEAGKSFLALYWSCLLASGVMQNGMATHAAGHEVLYLNWELRAPEMRARIAQLRRGHPELIRAPQHRHCNGALAEFARELKREIVTRQIDLVVIDSIASATMGDVTAAEAPNRFFEALDSLRCASILVGHQAKAGEGQQATAYGSVFYYNNPRMVYRVQKFQDEESDTFRMSLDHTKNNFGRKQKPTGFCFTIDSTKDSCTITRFNPTQDPILVKGLSTTHRIAQCLSDGQPWTVKLISESLDIGPSEIKTRLNDFEGKKWRRIAEGGGRGHETHWQILLKDTL